MPHSRQLKTVFALAGSALLLILASASGCGSARSGAAATPDPVHGNAIPPGILVRTTSAQIPQPRRPTHGFRPPARLANR